MLSPPMEHTVVTTPIEGPFGQTVTFVVTDGYQVTGTAAPDQG
jgi:hypothetical protein